MIGLFEWLLENQTFVCLFSMISCNQLRNQISNIRLFSMRATQTIRMRTDVSDISRFGIQYLCTNFVASRLMQQFSNITLLHSSVPLGSYSARGLHMPHLCLSSPQDQQRKVCQRLKSFYENKTLNKSLNMDFDTLQLTLKCTLLKDGTVCLSS